MDRQFGDLVAVARESLSPQALGAQEAAMVSWHSTEQPPPDSSAIPPTLVLHGSADLVIPPENFGALAARWERPPSRAIPRSARTPSSPKSHGARRG